MQHEFARSAGIHPSTLSALFVRSDANLGDSWTGFVDALGLTIDEALDESRKWRPPEPPAEDEGGSTNLRMGIAMFERSEGKVSRTVRKAMLRVLNSSGDRKPDEWMAAIRITRLAIGGAGAEGAEEKEPPPGVVPTVEAGKPLPANPPPAIPIRRKQPRR